MEMGRLKSLQKGVLAPLCSAPQAPAHDHMIPNLFAKIIIRSDLGSFCVSHVTLKMHVL